MKNQFALRWLIPLIVLLALFAAGGVADSLVITIPFLIFTLMNLLMAVLLLKNVDARKEPPLRA